MWRIKDDLFFDDAFPYENFVTLKKYGNQKDCAIRRTFCASRGIDFESLVTAEQVHGTNIAVAEAASKGKSISQCDGLVTDAVGLPLAVFTADCMPILIGSKKTRAVGLLHAGWRGLLKGIIENAVGIFERRFKAAPGDIIVSIGPHIQKCCYEISEDVAGLFGLAGGERKLDLSRIAVKKLSEMGVVDVCVNPHCSCHEQDLFFSYRKEKTENRMMSLVKI